MRRPAVIALLAAGLLAASAATAWACRCAPFKSAAEHLDKSALMITGRVIAIRPLPGDRHQFEARIQVSRTIKGRPLPVRYVVFETATSCGLPLQKGQKITLLPRWYDGRFRVGNCGFEPQFPIADYEKAARAQRR